LVWKIKAKIESVWARQSAAGASTYVRPRHVTRVASTTPIVSMGAVAAVRSSLQGADPLARLYFVEPFLFLFLSLALHTERAPHAALLYSLYSCRQEPPRPSQVLPLTRLSVCTGTEPREPPHHRVTEPSPPLRHAVAGEPPERDCTTASTPTHPPFRVQRN
jgi:hypothetical protein